MPKPHTIKAGRHQQQLKTFAGMVLANWTPDTLLTSLEGATEKEIADRCIELSKYPWTVNAILPDGSLQLRDPQCAGRVTTNAKTWEHCNRDGTLKDDIRTRPQGDVPLAALIDDEYCCKRMVTVKIEDLDTYQKIPWGTPAWFLRYRNRLQIENVNGMLKDRGGLKDGWCRVLNKTGHPRSARSRCRS